MCVHLRLRPRRANLATGMRDRQTCIDCGKKSPETETNYTLISAQFGWRLSRRRADNGEFIVEWRCPDCWRTHKKKSEEAPSGSSGRTIPDRTATLPSNTRSPVARSNPPPSSQPRSSSKPPTSAPPASPTRTRRP